MSDKAVEAAGEEYLKDHGGFHWAIQHALAAAYEADADNIGYTGTYATAIVEAWLRQRMKELRGEM